MCQRTSSRNVQARSNPGSFALVRESLVAVLVIALTLSGEASLRDRSAAERIHSVYLYLVARPAWPANQANRVFEEVREIWARYGITVDWGSVVTTKKRYDVVLQVRADEDEFARESPNRNPNALGGVLFVGGTRPRSIVFVAASTTRRLVEHASDWTSKPLREFAYARMLGRAIAHELGHILLVSKSHAAHGLMRPHFTRDDVMTSREAPFALQPSEAAALISRRDLAQVLARSTEPGMFDRLEAQALSSGSRQ
jgi:hypothetical protein